MAATMILENEPLTPAARVRDAFRGGSPVSAGGHTWVLSSGLEGIGPVWDRLFDDAQLAARFDPEDVRMAAFRLLHANYRVSAEEGVGLISRVPHGDLMRAVENALFGTEKVHRTYSDWVLSSLHCNGLDPAKVPADQLRNVLDQLVATNRAVPATSFVSSLEYAALRAGLGV